MYSYLSSCALWGDLAILTKKPCDKFGSCFQVTMGLEDLGNLVSASYQVVPSIPIFEKLLFLQ